MKSMSAALKVGLTALLVGGLGFAAFRFVAKGGNGAEGAGGGGPGLCRLPLRRQGGKRAAGAGGVGAVPRRHGPGR